ncbi:type VI secretion system contractile sheath domain-containing protein [Pseudomonas aeruginosa]
MRKKLSTQMDEILHHPDFQALESAWRGLQRCWSTAQSLRREHQDRDSQRFQSRTCWTISRTRPRVMQSGPVLQAHYTAEYGQFGGQPVGRHHRQLLHVAQFARRRKLMQYVSSVACMAHAPFVAAAGPKFFGLESFSCRT